MNPPLSITLTVWGAIAHLGLLSMTSSALLAADNASVNSSDPVRSIELPHLDPELPIAPGRNEFMAVCVACHSPRYFMMQPLFPQRQWEETVDKMAKTFGAQMDAEQRTAIVGYLVAVHGPGSATQRPATNDDDDPTSAAQLPPLPETAPALALPTDASQLAAEVKRGENLFALNCAGCHGPSGRGDGIVAAALLRKPKDLATTRFSLAYLSQVLWNGKPGAVMPSWRGLSQADRSALAAYVQSLHESVGAQPPSAQLVQQGSALFLLNCAPCHGEAGDGKGPTAATLLPRPANFKLKQPNTPYVLEVLRDGIPGTAMPSWKELISEPDRQALAQFVQSLFQGDNRP